MLITKLEENEVITIERVRTEHKFETMNDETNTYDKKNSNTQTVSIIVWGEYTISHDQSLETLNRTIQHSNGSDRLMMLFYYLLSCDFWGKHCLSILNPRFTLANEINPCLKLNFMQNVETF